MSAGGAGLAATLISPLAVVAGRRHGADEVVAKIKEVVPAALETHRVPGAAVALIDDARPVWASGFGVKNSRTREPMRADTVFEAASLSKTVAAYVTLRLCQTGQFELHTPLQRYLPELYEGNADLATITARHALSHTSGLPNWRRGKPLVRQSDPGSRFSYSGEGYFFLQRALEKVTGKPFRALARTEALVPLSMNNSDFGWNARYEQTAASGHDAEGAPVPRYEVRYGQYIKRGVFDPEIHVPFENAAASLYASVEDYARFVSAVLRPSKKTLSADWVTTMLTPQVDVEGGIKWALGWGLEASVEGRPFWHWGDTMAFQNFVIASRDSRRAIICFTNGFRGVEVYADATNMVLPGPHPALDFVGRGRRPPA